MSFAEVAAEIPRLSLAEKTELLHLLESQTKEAGAGGGLRLVRVDGRLLLSGGRTITQEEVNAILEDWP